MLKANLLKSLVLALSFGAAGAHASIVTNGSFEDGAGDLIIFNDPSQWNGDPGVTFDNLGAASPDKRWGVYENLNGWDARDGSGVEAVHSGNIVDGAGGTQFNAFDGNYFVELDTHFDYENPTNSNSWIRQQLTGLNIGQTYELSFAYAARTQDADDNGIGVYWGETEDLFGSLFQVSVDYDGSNWLNWTTYTYRFTASAAEMFLGFQALGNKAWDATHLGSQYYNADSNKYGGFLDAVNVTAVPEPGTLAALALGLVGLGAMRRRAK